MAKTPPGSGSLGSRLRGFGHCKRQDSGNDKKLRKQAQNQHGCVRAQRTGQNEREGEREREREALYRVLLLVRWRRRERQVVSGLRRKNTGHAHTRTHTRARPCPAWAPVGAASGHGSGWCPSFHLEDLHSDPCPWQAAGTAKQHRGSQIFKSQDSQKVINYRRQICH